MNLDSRVFLAGHNGMVGSAIHRKLKSLGFTNILTASKEEVDLCEQVDVRKYFGSVKPDIVILAAARVGGIVANNTYPANFIYDNLMIQNNIIKESLSVECERLLFLGSSCIYPRDAEQPMSEKSLLSGKLEATNEPYAIAKIAGIKLCESFNRQYGVDYRSVMPTNLYGPGDNFHSEQSHVIPGLMRRFHEAKVNDVEQVVVWGSGSPRREFLYVEDLADACCHVLSLEKKVIDEHVESMCSHINIGSGCEVMISDLARLVAKAVGYQGEIVFDRSKPDGTRRKLLDVELLSNLGWQASTDLEQGLKRTYDWYLSNIESIRK